MEIIEPIARKDAYKYYENKQMIDKINEIIEVINTLIKENQDGSNKTT